MGRMNIKQFTQNTVGNVVAECIHIFWDLK